MAASSEAFTVPNLLPSFVVLCTRVGLSSLPCLLSLLSFFFLAAFILFNINSVINNENIYKFLITTNVFCFLTKHAAPTELIVIAIPGYFLTSFTNVFPHVVLSLQPGDPSSITSYPQHLCSVSNSFLSSNDMDK